MKGTFTKPEYTIKTKLKCPKCGTFGEIETCITMVSVDKNWNESQEIVCPNCEWENDTNPPIIGQRKIKKGSRKEFFDFLK